MKNDDDEEGRVIKDEIEDDDEESEENEENEDFEWEEIFRREVKREIFRRKCKRYGIAAAIYVGFLALFFSQARFVALDSPSIPYRLCLQIFHLQPRKGDICAFRRHGLTLLKYIAAEEGDDVSNEKDDIYVNGRYVCRAARTETLTPVRSFFVPSGYAFVLGSHEDSLDSRYEEFGLVRTDDIEGTAIGLWKW
jgi:signal peptidase I